MSKTVQGAQAQGAEGVEGEKPRSKEEMEALLAAQGGPTAMIGGGHAGAVSGMLAKAGLGVAGVGAATGVRPSDRVDITRGTGRVLMEKLYGKEEPVLKPPAPLPVEITPELRMGAETFVGNIDRVVNGLFSTTGEAVGGGESVLSRGLAPEQALREIFYSGVSDDAAPPSLSLGRVQSAQVAEWVHALPNDGQGPVQLDAQGAPIVPPNLTPADVFTGANVRNVAEGILARGGLRPAGVGGLAPDDMRKISAISADMLLAMFLKLNITDPNNSPEVHNMLHSLSSELRQLGLDEAKGKNEMAALKMKNAAAYAEQAKTAGTVIMIITIIISIIVTVLTLGTAAAATTAGAVAVNAAVQTGVQVVQQAATQTMTEVMLEVVKKVIIGILVTLLLQLANAAVQKEAQDQSLDAQQSENAAKKAQQQADKEQAVVEEEAAVMKLIMEAKNQVIDAVLKMLNAMSATQTKVLSAGMSR